MTAYLAPLMHPHRWGDPERPAALPESVRGLVELAFGVVDSPAVEHPSVPRSALDPDLRAALAGIVGADQVLTDDFTRARRTRGKSTPDLLRARAGDYADAPDAVVRPGSHDEVQAVLELAGERRVAVVPYGGGTAVTGGLAPARDGFDTVLALDLIRLDRLVDLDPVSHTATLQAGMRGPAAEAALAEHGFTLGHFPQSFEWASIGGFAATRSSGQSSAGFGRFDSLVVGLTVATPTGSVRLGVAPASAAGPDLRQVFLGSEGALGVITSVTVRIRPQAARADYAAWRFESFAQGVEALRDLAQSRHLPTVLRLSDETETALNLAAPDQIGGEGASGALVIVGQDGEPDPEVTARLAAAGGVSLGAERGEHWREGRFAAPYLRDALLDVGVLVETLETATYWSKVPQLYAEVSAALAAHLGEPTLVLCHVSHVYETGCSLYFTVVTRVGEQPLVTWAEAKRAASDAIVRAGGTITHHHAVGRDHRPWLVEELGPVGLRMLRALKGELDPAGVLNPGVLIE